jgi:hypothetical protein
MPALAVLEAFQVGSQLWIVSPARCRRRFSFFKIKFAGASPPILHAGIFSPLASRAESSRRDLSLQRASASL